MNTKDYFDQLFTDQKEENSERISQYLQQVLFATEEDMLPIKERMFLLSDTSVRIMWAMNSKLHEQFLQQVKQIDQPKIASSVEEHISFFIFSSKEKRDEAFACLCLLAEATGFTDFAIKVEDIHSQQLFLWKEFETPRALFIDTNKIAKESAIYEPRH